jgi:hypothetical protein
MSRNKDVNLLLGSFFDEEDLLSAGKMLKLNNIAIKDIYTPFPVHGLDEILEIKRSRLPIVCFFSSILGLSLAIYFQIWTSQVDWPLNVGGKPFNSFVAFLPVTFEVMVLFGAIITVFAFFLRSNLFPGKDAKILNVKITDDTFVLAIECINSGIDAEFAAEIMTSHGATDVCHRWEEK